MGISPLVPSTRRSHEGNMSSARNQPVVVVGAGLSGLTAANALLRAGRQVVVLEARSRAGGRLASHSFADGSIVDLGGQWHGPGQDRIIELAKRFDLETRDTFTQGSSLFEFMGRSGSYRSAAPLALG